jgi:hypothetical protein
MKCKSCSSNASCVLPFWLILIFFSGLIPGFVQAQHYTLDLDPDGTGAILFQETHFNGSFDVLTEDQGIFNMRDNDPGPATPYIMYRARSVFLWPGYACKLTDEHGGKMIFQESTLEIPDRRWMNVKIYRKAFGNNVRYVGKICQQAVSVPGPGGDRPLMCHYFVEGENDNRIPDAFPGISNSYIHTKYVRNRQGSKTWFTKSPEVRLYRKVRYEGPWLCDLEPENYTQDCLSREVSDGGAAFVFHSIYIPPGKRVKVFMESVNGINVSVTLEKSVPNLEQSTLRTYAPRNPDNVAKDIVRMVVFE